MTVVKWLRVPRMLVSPEFQEIKKLAEQGDAGMQYKLGEMYYNGDGVSKSVVSAYLWVSAAANNGYKPAPGTRDEVAKEMTAEQIAEAKARLASIEWDKGRGLNQ